MTRSKKVSKTVDLMLEKNRYFDFFPYVPGDAFENMAWDEALFWSVQNKKRNATFRLYGWREDSISLGYFQSTQNLDRKQLKTKNIPLVRRITGGRAVYHQKELTYSLALQLGDRTVSKKKLFEEISSLILAGLQSFGLNCSLSGKSFDPPSKDKSNCFARTSFCEIVDQKGTKRVGMALLIQDSSLLAQGSIPLSPEYQKIEEFFRDDFSLSSINSSSSSSARLTDSSSLFKKNLLKKENKEENKKEENKENLFDSSLERFIESFMKGLSKTITLKKSSLTQREKTHLKQKKEKYQDPKWTFQR